MLRALPAPLLLATWVAVWAAPPTPEPCKSEMNKVKDLLQVDCADRALEGVPAGLPQETGILLLASNRLARADLAALQHLPQLSELDLSNNSLAALETGAHLPNLRQLLLSHNVLERLPTFPGLPSLRRLALGHNQLSVLPEGGFCGLGQLHELELQGNRLQSLSGGAFCGLGQLRDLDLSDNRLEALPAMLLAELPNLEVLRLERNGLQRLPEGFFLETNYAYVYLAGNPWRCDCRLAYLRNWLRENELSVYVRTTVREGASDMEVNQNEPLSVQCQAPPQEEGRPVLHFQSACRRLSDDQDKEEEEEEGRREPTKDSRIPFPLPLPSAATATATLTTGPRAASCCPISTSAEISKAKSSPTATGLHPSAASAISATTSSPLAQKPTALVPPTPYPPSVPPNTTIPPLSEPCQSQMNKVKDLLQVDCADRGLEGVPTGLPQETGILLLASNRLARADLAAFQHLPQLSELDLSNNSLAALETGAHLPNLQQLLLSHNALERLPAFPGLPSLRRLALGHNQLSALPEGGFRGLGQLRELELQGNRLQKLPGGAFQGLAELRDLDLSDNRLEALPADLLANLPVLAILGLERNRLQRLPEGFFLEETDYAYVYLAENPWRCDCRLAYLRNWIRENELSVYVRTTVREGASDMEVTKNEPLSVQCQAPPQEEGRPVLHFQAACRRLADDQDNEEGSLPRTAGPPV